MPGEQPILKHAHTHCLTQVFTSLSLKRSQNEMSFSQGYRGLVSVTNKPSCSFASALMNLKIISRSQLPFKNQHSQIKNPAATAPHEASRSVFKFHFNVFDHDVRWGMQSAHQTCSRSKLGACHWTHLSQLVKVNHTARYRVMIRCPGYISLYIQYSMKHCEALIFLLLMQMRTGACRECDMHHWSDMHLAHRCRVHVSLRHVHTK